MHAHELRTLIVADRLLASERGASHQEIADAACVSVLSANTATRALRRAGVRLELVCSCHARFGRVYRYATGQQRITTDAAEEVLA